MLPPTIPTLIEPWLLRMLMEELQRAGHPVQAMLDGSGLRPEDLRDPELRLDGLQMRPCLEQALGLLEAATLGCRLGMRLNPVSWGDCYLGLAAAPDALAALSFGARHAPCARGLVDLHCLSTPEGTQLVAQPLFDGFELGRFLVELNFAAFANLLRRVAGRAAAPVRAEFRAGHPADASVHQAALGCAVRFAQPQDRLHLPPLAGLPLETADESVHATARARLEAREGEQAARHRLQVQIVQAVRRRLSAPPTLEELAASLQMSERTLRRRLAERGISYSDILDAERRLQALQHLRVGLQPLREIARLCGYSDARSLRRAIQRWTGRAPSSLMRGDDA